MSRPATLLLAALVLAGCTRGGSPPPKIHPPVLAPSVPASSASEARDPDPRYAERCGELTRLAEAGDYKQATDLMTLLRTARAPCPEHDLEAAELSRRFLESADEWIRSSTRRKQVGDVRGAIQDLERALEIYPRYYWAQKLLRDLGERPPAPQETVATIAEVAPGPAPTEAPEPRARRTPPSDVAVETDVEVLRQLIAEQNLELARIAEQEGNLEAASGWALRAMKAEPGDSNVLRALIEFVRLLGLKFFSAGELTPARELWVEALALDGSDPRLRDYLRQVDERLESLEQIRRKSGS